MDILGYFDFRRDFFCRFRNELVTSFLTDAMPEGLPTAISRFLTLIKNVVCYTMYCIDNIISVLSYGHWSL